MKNQRYTHYSLYPFALADKNAGGLPSVFLKEVHTHRNLVLFTTDDSNYTLENAAVMATPVRGCNITDLTRYWFGLGCWQWLHPDAYTDRKGDPIANRLMLQINADTPEVTYEMVNAFCHKNALSSDLDNVFNSSFDNHLLSIKPGSIVNWQDYFFVPSIIKHAKRLKALGVFQTLHIHTSFPESLFDSIFGRKVLTAMSYVDSVYLHTDEYIGRAEKQMEKLKLTMPSLKRFDLGIDQVRLDGSIALIKGKGMSVSESISGLARGLENGIVEEILSTQNEVPHRFICVDRVDPSKGNVTVIKAVIGFLEKRMMQGKSLDEMRKSYRFYFIQPNLNKPFDPEHLKNGWYAKYLRELFADAVERFSGIVFVSDSLSGKQRQLIPVMMLKAHGITGGAEDGLNLAIQENIYVNREENTSAICGDGTGFSMHVKSLGLERCAFFPKSGDVNNFLQHIEEIVRLQKNPNDIFKNRKTPLVKHIKQRSASVIVDR